MPLIDLHECLDEIRRHSLFCRDMMQHVAAWFTLEDSTHQKETRKPPLYRLFYPLFSLNTDTKSVRMQTMILDYCITNSAVFREKSIAYLIKIATIKLDNYADRFKHPPWKKLKIKVGKQSAVPFRHPSLTSFDQSSFNPLRDIVNCLLAALDDITITPFGEFLLHKENLKSLNRALNRAVVDMIVNLSPQIDAFSDSEQCKEATGYTLYQMQKLVKNCQKQLRRSKPRATSPSIISNLPAVSHSLLEDSEISK